MGGAADAIDQHARTIGSQQALSWLLASCPREEGLLCFSLSPLVLAPLCLGKVNIPSFYVLSARPGASVRRLGSGSRRCNLLLAFFCLVLFYVALAA